MEIAAGRWGDPGVWKRLASGASRSSDGNLRCRDPKNAGREEPGGWVPEERITVAQAVHAYSMGSAFAEHQEKVKGTIEPGKLADLVVLSDDIFAIAAEAIEKTRVDLTIFDGRVVYERK